MKHPERQRGVGGNGSHPGRSDELRHHDTGERVRNDARSEKDAESVGTGQSGGERTWRRRAAGRWRTIAAGPSEHRHGHHESAKLRPAPTLESRDLVQQQQQPLSSTHFIKGLVNPWLYSSTSWYVHGLVHLRVFCILVHLWLGLSISGVHAAVCFV
jgi:hypothetical protein